MENGQQIINNLYFKESSHLVPCAYIIIYYSSLLQIKKKKHEHVTSILVPTSFK